jgi:hypothetical protein
MNTTPYTNGNAASMPSSAARGRRTSRPTQRRTSCHLDSHVQGSTRMSSSTLERPAPGPIAPPTTFFGPQASPTERATPRSA